MVIVSKVPSAVEPPDVISSTAGVHVREIVLVQVPFVLNFSLLALNFIHYVVECLG